MSGKAHLFILAVSVSSIGFILYLVRHRRLRAKYSILWLSIGMILVGLSASPDLLDRLSVLLGISYGPTTFFLGAITLLFLVVVHFSWELSRLEERSRVLAEEIAILRAQLEHPGPELASTDPPQDSSPPLGVGRGAREH
ncbi:MAG: DUF2304 domain-containing protein [Actinomycetota bacterium]|nr:DUF2304 domain-containing protein [Actinomycetota bacterium]